MNHQTFLAFHGGVPVVVIVVIVIFVIIAASSGGGGGGKPKKDVKKGRKGKSRTTINITNVYKKD